MGTGRHRSWCAGGCLGRCTDEEARDRRSNRPIELQKRSKAATTSRTPATVRTKRTTRTTDTSRTSGAAPTSSTPRHSRQSSGHDTGHRSSAHGSGNPARHHVSETAPSRQTSGYSHSREYSSGHRSSGYPSDSVQGNYPSDSLQGRSGSDTFTPRGSTHSIAATQGTAPDRTAQWLQGLSLNVTTSGRTSEAHSRQSSDPPRASRSGRSSGIVVPGLGDPLPTDPAAYPYGRHQMQGALRQRWLQDDYAPNCPLVMKAPLSFREMANRPNRRDRWVIGINSWVRSPPGFDEELRNQDLPYGPDTYRQVRIQGPPNPNPYNDYMHMTTEGAIFAMDISRDGGPHWCEIAAAQYTMDFRLEGLRHIYFHHVINEDTKRFVVNKIYAPLMPEGFAHSREADTQLVWALGTPEYQGLMGTTFGKGVAALLLTYFPRGSVIVSRVVTWRARDLHIRFDIESITYTQSLHF